MNYREGQAREINKELEKRKAVYTYLEDLSVEVDQLVETRGIARAINGEVIRILEEMRSFDEKALHIQTAMAAAIARSDHLSDEMNMNVLDRMKDSDSQIARARAVLKKTMQELSKLSGEGHLDSSEARLFATHIKWADLMVQVISYVGQGHQSIKNRDPAKARAFYKKSQHMLLESSLKDSRRQRWIREISDVLNGSRTNISTELMPETQYNPPEPEKTVESTNEPDSATS